MGKIYGKIDDGPLELMIQSGNNRCNTPNAFWSSFAFDQEDYRAKLRDFYG